MPSAVAELLIVTTDFFLWFMVGRVVLALISGGRQTFFTQLFERATFPVWWVVRRVTPRAVGNAHIPILSLPLLLTLRIWLITVARTAG
ncbi:MAG: hypothetical protein U0821_07480 [Chloroflexota bacterium]